MREERSPLYSGGVSLRAPLHSTCEISVFTGRRPRDFTLDVYFRLLTSPDSNGRIDLFSNKTSHVLLFLTINNVDDVACLRIAPECPLACALCAHGKLPTVNHEPYIYISRMNFVNEIHILIDLSPFRYSSI